MAAPSALCHPHCVCETATAPIAHSPQCIHRTALFLAYMACRGMIDGAEHPQAVSTTQRISELFREDWLDGLNLDPPEKRFIHAPFGTLQQSQRNESSWLIENAAVLAWTMNLAELPPFYQKVNGGEISKALGILRADHFERIATASIRDANEIVAGFETYAALWWRLTEYKKNPRPMDFQTKLTEPDSHHLVVDGIEFIDRDLAVDGKPISQAGAELRDFAGAIVHQRYREFRYLLGMEQSGSRITSLN